MTKASASTKATATALLSRDMVKPELMKAGALLLWDRAIAKVRRRTA